MRRKASMDVRKNEIEKEQAVYQQELELLKGQYKANNEKSLVAHKAELDKIAAEHKAEVEKIEAGHEKEKQEILHQIRLKEIELDDKRKHWQRQYHKFTKALEAVSLTFSSGYPMNPDIAKNSIDLIMALKEEVNNEPKPVPEPKSTENKSPENLNRATAPASPLGADKVEKLTNTLLGLLNPKK
jgi:hypothetical protein